MIFFRFYGFWGNWYFCCLENINLKNVLFDIFGFLNINNLDIWVLELYELIRRVCCEDFCSCIMVLKKCFNCSVIVDILEKIVILIDIFRVLEIGCV